MNIERTERGLHVSSGGNLAVFLLLEPGVYEVHMDFALRGRAALTLMGEMLDVIKAEAVFAAIPPERRDVCWFARKCGFQSLGEAMTRIGVCKLFVRRF